MVLFAQELFTGFLVFFASYCVSGFIAGRHIDSYAPVHSSGTVSSNGIMVHSVTSKMLRLLSKSVALPHGARQFAVYFYVHVEIGAFMDLNKDVKLNWAPSYTLWCYPGNANLETDPAHFALTLSKLDMHVQGRYNINTHVHIPVPEELTIQRKRYPYNKCLLIEDDPVPLSELRWELHIVPEWSWVDIFPRGLVDEFYRAFAIMGLGFGQNAAPSQATTWFDGTDIATSGAKEQFHRRATIAAFIQAADGAAFLNRTMSRQNNGK